MNPRLDYFATLLDNLINHCQKTLAGDPLHSQEAADGLMDTLQQCQSELQSGGDYPAIGQQLIGTIVTHFPDIMPSVHRDLLWCFGGECLHFLGDEELERYQALEDRYFLDTPEQCSQASDGNRYRDLRAQVFGMH